MAAVEILFRVMASDTHLVVVDGPASSATQARSLLDRLEQRWSRFLVGSDLTRINTHPGEPVPVSAETRALVATMVEAWRVTGCRYDPSILPALIAAGYRASLVEPRNVTALAAGARSGADLAAVVVDDATGTVQVPEGMALDPGGIGKGLAADLVVAHLLRAGAAGALVGIGGDLAMAGRPPEPTGWRVAVEAPDARDSILGTIAVDAGGVATSSTRSRRWEHDGRARHHVIDPVAGAPSDTDLATVTVVAPSGWLAEAHATAALLAGAAGVIGYLEGHDLSGVAVTVDGSTLTTPDLASLTTPIPAGAR